MNPIEASTNMEWMMAQEPVEIEIEDFAPEEPDDVEVEEKHTDSEEALSEEERSRFIDFA